MNDTQPLTPDELAAMMMEHHADHRPDDYGSGCIGTAQTDRAHCQPYLLAYDMRKILTALLLSRKSRTRNREARLTAEAEVRRLTDQLTIARQAANRHAGIAALKAQLAEQTAAITRVRAEAFRAIEDEVLTSVTPMPPRWARHFADALDRARAALDGVGQPEPKRVTVDSQWGTGCECWVIGERVEWNPNCPPHGATTGAGQ